MIDFYRVSDFNVGLGVGVATLGPMPSSRQTVPALQSCYRPTSFPNSVTANLINDSRAVSWPGALRVERPARGVIPCADPQDITLNSTITLDDGVNPAVAFEFVSGGAAAPGNVAVDIAGMTTAAEVATELADEINDNRTGGADPTMHVATANGAGVYLAQAILEKEAGGASSGTWFGKAGDGLGNCILGNVAIVASVPGEWPGIIGMSGGRDRSQGVMVSPAAQNGLKLQCGFLAFGLGEGGGE